MASKQLNQLSAKSAVLHNDDLIIIYDSEESGSEKSKKVAMSDFIGVITSSHTIYVDPTGSDVTGDGTVGNPFATPNAAMEWVSNRFVTNGAGATIQLADGTYNLSSSITAWGANGPIEIRGNPSTPANVTLNFSGMTGISVGGNSYLQIDGLTIDGNDTSFTSGIISQRGASVFVQNCVITDFYFGMQAFVGGLIYSVNVNPTSCEYGILSYSVSSIMYTNGTITGNQVGISAELAAEVVMSNSTNSGNVTATNIATNGRLTTV